MWLNVAFPIIIVLTPFPSKVIWWDSRIRISSSIAYYGDSTLGDSLSVNLNRRILQTP